MRVKPMRVKVYSTHNEIEAMVVQGMLQVCGVKTEVQDKSLKDAGYPGVPGMKKGNLFDLWVDQNHVEVALKIIEGWTTEQNSKRMLKSEPKVHGFLTNLRNWIRGG